MSHSHAESSAILQRENVELAPGAGRRASIICIGLGAIAIIAIFLIGLITTDPIVARTALHAYHVGFLTVLGFSLGSLVFTMMFHQTNAGWIATCRRQFENVMSLVWVGGLLFVLGVVLQLITSARSGAYLWEWMDADYVRGDLLYEKKAAYLNVGFFFIRAVIYFGAWLLLSFFLYSWSTRQDTEPDKWLTAHARKLSAPGLLIFALTVAFAGFDWIMLLDYHWFSTMLGVYFFAGSTVSGVALSTLVLIVLRQRGRMQGAFNEEHLHDLSKLVFAFTVFWAYIAFSQYFLIWYANIPEETGWFEIRKRGDWEILSYVIPIAHFIVPFIFLMARTVRRSFTLMAFGCVWVIVAHMIDWYWAVRPEVSAADGGPLGPQPLDLLGIAGPVLIFTGLLIRQIGRTPLIPVNDPRLSEALEHKNYI